MITIKKKFKRIFCLIAAFVITVASIPGITASAADYSLVFEMQESLFSGWTSEQISAFKSLKVIYVNSSIQSTEYVYSDFYSRSFPFSDSDSLYPKIIFYNTSPYKIRLGLKGFSQNTWLANFVIPSGTYDDPGVLSLSPSSFSSLSTWNKTGNIVLYSYKDLIPVLDTDLGDYSTATANFFFQLPHGELLDQTYEITPPEGTVGSWSFRPADYAAHIYPSIPGYKVDPAFSLPSTITLAQDEIQTYYIPYVLDESTTKFAYISYYDEHMNLLYKKSVPFGSLDTSIVVPDYKDYYIFPQVVFLDHLASENYFNVYCVDFTEELDRAFNSGFNEGYNSGVLDGPRSEDIYQEGYDAGLHQGLSQNSLTAEQVQKYTSDYNAITGFFNGAFNSIKNTFFFVTSEISYKGVSLFDLFSVFLMIVVISFGIKYIT